MFNIGKTYTFNTNAPSLLGASLVNAKLLSIMDYETARQYDNIDLRYRAIYPSLPLGTADKSKSTIYYRFQSQSGEKVVFAHEWIELGSVQVVEHITIQVLLTEASMEDMGRLRNILNANGYTKYNITEV